MQNDTFARMKALVGFALALTFMGCGSSSAPPPPPAPPAKTCVGTAKACSDLGETACKSQSGCTFSPGVCSGRAIPCGEGLTIQVTCVDQPGCHWDGADGSAVYGTCSGTVTPCEMLTTNECRTVQECAISPDICSGTARDCGAYILAADCGAQLGCTWM